MKMNARASAALVCIVRGRTGSELWESGWVGKGKEMSPAGLLRSLIRENTATHYNHPERFEEGCNMPRRTIVLEAKASLVADALEGLNRLLFWDSALRSISHVVST